MDGAESFSPVHQRFYFLFIHTDVVDCGLLLHGHLLLFLLLLVFVVFERVWAHWRRFSGHSQADDMMGHRWEMVCWHAHTYTHTLKKDTPVTYINLWTNSKSDEARQKVTPHTFIFWHKYTVTQQTNTVTYCSLATVTRQDRLCTSPHVETVWRGLLQNWYAVSKESKESKESGGRACFRPSSAVSLTYQPKSKFFILKLRHMMENTNY